MHPEIERAKVVVMLTVMVMKTSLMTRGVRRAVTTDTQRGWMPGKSTSGAKLRRRRRRSRSSRCLRLCCKRLSGCCVCVVATLYSCIMQGTRFHTYPHTSTHPPFTHILLYVNKTQVHASIFIHTRTHTHARSHARTHPPRP